MAQPVTVQDATLRQFAGSLRSAFSVPQWKYFVTVLVGLLHCDAAHRLSGLLRYHQFGGGKCVCLGQRRLADVQVWHPTWPGQQPPCQKTTDCADRQAGQEQASICHWLPPASRYQMPGSRR